MAGCEARTSARDQMILHAEDMEVQHRRLAQLVTEMASLLGRDQRRCPGARRLLSNLISFSEIHFSDQEEFMKQNAYPSELLKLHETAHGEFLEKLRSVHDNSDADLIAVAPALIAWIRDWIEDHLFTEDQAYLDYFRKEFRI